MEKSKNIRTKSIFTQKKKKRSLSPFLSSLYIYFFSIFSSLSSLTIHFSQFFSLFLLQTSSPYLYLPPLLLLFFKLWPKISLSFFDFFSFFQFFFLSFVVVMSFVPIVGGVVMSFVAGCGCCCDGFCGWLWVW